MPMYTATLDEMRAELAGLPSRQQAALRAGRGPEALALKRRAEDLTILVQAGAIDAANQAIYLLESQMEQIRAERVTLRAEADARYAQAERDQVRARTEIETAERARQQAIMDVQAARDHGQDVEARLQAARAQRDALLSGEPRPAFAPA